MKGDEIGRFKFGSTVILLFKNQTANWEDRIDAHAAVQMGQKLGSVNKAQ
jgi:phosphatidylserine decarboxylase